MIFMCEVWNGQEFDLPQPPPLFFSEKKPDPENPEKSGSKNLDIFDEILINVHRIGLIYEIKPRYFEIFTKSSIFKIEIW